MQWALQPVLDHPFRRILDYQNPESTRTLNEAINNYLLIALERRNMAFHLAKFTKDEDKAVYLMFFCLVQGYQQFVVPLHTWNSFLQFHDVFVEKWPQMQADEFTLEMCLKHVSDSVQKYSSYYEGCDLDKPWEGSPV
jgi:hypothetical protein